MELDTSETAVDQNAATPTLDPSARAFVLVVNQNAILWLVAGKKVIHECSLYFCVMFNKSSISQLPPIYISTVFTLRM